MTDFHINPALDTALLAEKLRATGRLQIPDFTTVDTANKLHKLLTQHEHWHLTYNEGAEN
ncbi:MAG: hypothetical protein L7T24_04850 [Luminiphilus sp.]|nr:hypothetical protein [Luminiphilus sp.]